ncbi:MAG: mannose-1-phosphate guanylyltransferase [Balneolaceae bacterium]|nr:mannose-1-phosphate guanylyltransferase [Balneolaceae bacterium]
MIYAVIMAGGAGTRFWPKSRMQKPKQFLNLFGGRSMLQQTADRLDGFIAKDKIMVITNQSYRPLVQEQLPGLIDSFLIGEPVARNTAPCIASAASLLYKENPQAVMVVLPADHRIGNPEAFKKVLASAVETARSEETLVTIGIEPNRPETGYGYIRREVKPDAKRGENSVYKVKNFTEKPDLPTAEQFLKSGDYLWNSGMFIWKVSTIVDVFKHHLPGIYEQMERLIVSDKSAKDIDLFYEKCPSVSIDYGIMEKAESVHVVPGSFDWNDVGSWKAVHELSKKDPAGNAAGKSKALFHKSGTNLVHTDSGKLVTFVGVDEVALVETDDAILVVNLSETQEVKKLVDILGEDPDLEHYI